MSKSTLRFQVEDISALAKVLKKATEQKDVSPSHVEWLNILAHAAGYKNFQHFKASSKAEQRLAAPKLLLQTVDHLLIEKTLRHFDSRSRLVRWPSHFSQRELCLWWLWSCFPAKEPLAESEVKTLLMHLISFEDHAILRRTLVDLDFVTRNTDGSAYKRNEMPPTATAKTFISLVKLRVSENQ
nr:DUF2087 domain-containing protein [uncultured Cohaesibacter sp.]